MKLLACLCICLALHAKPFSELEFSQVDKQKMDAMIEPLATWSLLRLGFNQKEVERRGYATSHISPLKALDYLCAKSGQKVNMLKVKKRGMIWSRLSQGYADRLKQLHADGVLLEQIDAFAASLEIPPAQLKEFIEKQDWLGFVNALVQ